MRPAITFFNIQLSNSRVYVQKYVKHKTLDEMLQEWSGASKFILAMDTWFERLMAE